MLRILSGLVKSSNPPSYPSRNNLVGALVGRFGQEAVVRHGQVSVLGKPAALQLSLLSAHSTHKTLGWESLS